MKAPGLSRRQTPPISCCPPSSVRRASSPHSLVIERAVAKGVRIIPVDSEHSAVFQCLEASSPKSVGRVILTASGGPFLRATRTELENVRISDALNHPNWKMGKKITIDSATMMNKGLEVIEARWLFGVDYDRIDVVIHPQSIIHSLVEFVDGSVMAQLGLPDMRGPISYALFYPERTQGGFPPFELSKIGRLEFQAPWDTRRAGRQAPCRQ